MENLNSVMAKLMELGAEAKEMQERTQSAQRDALEKK
jgi:hypothetical protein